MEKLKNEQREHVELAGGRRTKMKWEEKDAAEEKAGTEPSTFPNSWVPLFFKLLARSGSQNAPSILNVGPRNADIDTHTETALKTHIVAKRWEVFICVKAK